METTKTVTLRLAPELLEQIDEARGLIPREAWLRQAAEEKLDRERNSGGGDRGK